MPLAESKLDTLKFAMAVDAPSGTRISVVGVGGGGSNAVAQMLADGVEGVQFSVINTDQQALSACPVPAKLAIGEKITNGLGAGSDPAIGRQAALEDTGRIIELLEGADMVFVAACLGGGTGTGASPVVANLAKELNALVVAVVTTPFAFEGPRRMMLAEQGLAELASTVDVVITVPNEKLLTILPAEATLDEALRTSNDVLRQAVEGISNIITTPGVINRDFSDVRSAMQGMGYAMMGTASARGEHAAVEAAQLAISSKLLDEGGVAGARSILVNFTSAPGRLMLRDFYAAARLIREAAANDEAQISFGIVHDETLGDEVKVTVVATGFQRAAQRFPERAEAPRIDVAPPPAADDPQLAAQQAAAEYKPEPPAPQQSQIEYPPEQPSAPPAEEPMGQNYLDIPTILRRGRRPLQ